ncbi:MAG: Lrp/AsnC ligand binding domain-containing protein [Actinomycetota bacterium]
MREVVRAYILIQNQVGVSDEVARGVAKIKGVASADVVTGPYDVIALAEAGSLDELGQLVVGKVQAIDGVTRTLTCPMMSL